MNSSSNVWSPATIQQINCRFTTKGTGCNAHLRNKVTINYVAFTTENTAQDVFLSLNLQNLLQSLGVFSLQTSIFQCYTSQKHSKMQKKNILGDVKTEHEISF